MATRTIKVDYLARVEGEGALNLDIRDGRVASAELRIFEPPRFFEAFLRGRDHAELPDIVARICGICPIAYQMSAVHAVEDAFGGTVGGQLRALRRLIYCGEWIESHALHVVMLHAPDFLGYPDSIQMARDHGDIVRKGLQLKKAGNELIRVLGGREIHPVSVKPGGFHRVPTTQRTGAGRRKPGKGPRHRGGTDALRRRLRVPRLRAGLRVRRASPSRRIPLQRGPARLEPGHRHRHRRLRRRCSRSGMWRIPPPCTRMCRERGAYLVGPLARYALNFDRLPASVQDLARSSGLGPVCRNPFRSIIVRALEIVYACEEALRLIGEYERPEVAGIELEPRAGVGFGCTEAPRGICWHRYEFDADGTILGARIVPPTSQNQPSIEADLAAVATGLIDEPDDVIRDRCEQGIRNYDPCISCSAHFLKLSVKRR